MVEEIDGTGYQWGPSGVVTTDALTQKRADSCLADAMKVGCECKSNRGTAGVSPASVVFAMQARCLRYKRSHRLFVPLRGGQSSRSIASWGRGGKVMG